MYSIEQLHKWQQSVSHDVVAKVISKRLGEWYPKAYGEQAVVLGDFLKEITPPKHNFSRTLHLGRYQGDTLCDLHALPLKEDSCELCVVPFGFDFANDPYQLMRESNRILAAGGYMVIFAFNPLSLISLGGILPMLQANLPWSGHFIQPTQMKDWLTLLGYQMTEHGRMLYNPLLYKSGQPTRFDAYFEKLFPSAGSVYWMVAKKQRAPLTPQHSLETLKNNVWIPLAAVNRKGY